MHWRYWYLGFLYGWNDLVFQGTVFGFVGITFEACFFVLLFFLFFFLVFFF